MRSWFGIDWKMEIMSQFLFFYPVGLLANGAFDILLLSSMVGVFDHE